MKHNSGFSLLQVCIALIIIGLIVGSILTGQDLIKSAAITAQISQISKYQQAVINFQTKYNGYLPGDIPTPYAANFGFYVTNCDGTTGKRDGNGLIDGYWTGTWVLQGTGETALFWQDLSTANLVDGSFPSNGVNWVWCGGVASPLSLASGTYYIGNYFPAGKIGKGTFVYVYDGQQTSYQDSSGNWYKLGGDNWYGLSAITSVLTNGGMVSSPALSVMQAYNIDKKIDDGILNQGNVRAIYLSNWQGYTAGQSHLNNPIHMK